MKLSEMKQILSEGDIQLTKSLGQNFLHDGNQLRRIVEAAKLTRTDKVLEIGPGLGPLTELLLESAGEVLAIEKDVRLVQVLEQRFKVKQASSQSAQAQAVEKPTIKAPALRLIHDDALDYLVLQPRDWSDWKLVANLPYSVASPILVELALAQRGPQRMVATLQIEVARRLAAKSGEPDYGLLTLLVQLDYEPQGWFKIPAGCFFPEPEVDSACISLVRREQPLLPLNQRRVFSKVVKRGFSQRRKMMFKLLKADWPVAKLEDAFQKLGLSLQVRAEALNLAQFVSLAQLLAAEK